MHLAPAIDGFHDDVPGGAVRLRPSGAPLLDYPSPRGSGRHFATSLGVNPQESIHGLARLMTTRLAAR